MPSLQFIYRAPSLASAAEGITDLMICAILRMDQLSVGSGQSFHMKKRPPVLLLVFVSDR